MSTAVTTQTAKTFRDLLAAPAYKEQIQQALPRGITAERMTRVVLTAINKTPALLECSKESLWEAVLNCASLGLFPDALGRAYLVPFKGQCQLIIGYKGLIDLAYRSDRIASIQLVIVREGDIFERKPLAMPPIHHVIKEAVNDAFRVMTHVYSVVYLKGCENPSVDVMSKREVDEIKARSQSAGKATSPWKTDYEEMAKKTVFRRHAKVLPMSAELAQALTVDADRIEMDVPSETAGRFTKDTAKPVEGQIVPDITHAQCVEFSKALPEPAVTALLAGYSVHSIGDVPIDKLPDLWSGLQKIQAGVNTSTTGGRP
jgi:recombination protein RecT